MRGKRERIRTVDTVRGLAMLIILFYHLVYRAQDSLVDQAVREAGCWVIPFFFLVSGYFYDPDRRTVREELRRREENLLRPALTATVFLLLTGGVYCVLLHGYSPRDWARDAVYTYLRPELASLLLPGWGDAGVLFNNISPVWFIWTMCWTTLLFVPLAHAARRDWARTAGLCVLLLALEIPLYLCLPPSPWSVTHVPVYTAVMLFGAWAGRARLLDRVMDMEPRRAVLCAAAAAALHAALFCFCGTDLMYAGPLGTKGWIDPPVFFVQTVVGTFAMLTLGRGLDRVSRGAAAALAWMGGRSVVYLLWHMAFGVVAADALRTYIKPGPDWYVAPLTPEIVLKSAAGYLFAILGCTALAAARDRYGTRRRSA